MEKRFFIIIGKTRSRLANIYSQRVEYNQVPSDIEKCYRVINLLIQWSLI